MSIAQKKKPSKSKKKGKQLRVDPDVDVAMEGDNDDSSNKDVGATKPSVDPIATPFVQSMLRGCQTFRPLIVT